LLKSKFSELGLVIVLIFTVVFLEVGTTVYSLEVNVKIAAMLIVTVGLRCV